MEFEHVPVLLSPTIKHLNCRSDGVYVDCTLGGGGHSLEIVKQLGKEGKLIGIDRDQAAIEAARKKLIDTDCEVELIQANFCELESILDEIGVKVVDGVLFDLGVSSYQLDNPERGFSYRQEASLDMRMNQNQETTAADIVNNASFEKLEQIINDYGEEKWAGRIAQFIVNKRSQSPIITTTELVDIIKAAIPASARRKGPHPAKRTFQALRIAVNGELEVIKPAVKKAINRLRKGGRICVITFHSLEDKIVKDLFAELAENCICPPKFPICACEKQAEVKIITKRAPTKEEIKENSRARSAQLRVAKKL